MPSQLAPWLAAHPQVDIALCERQSADIARSVAQGFADIGVLSDAVDTTGLTLCRFATDRLVVVAARGHPRGRLAEVRPAEVRLADLAGEPFLALADGALQDHLDAQAAKAGLRFRPRIRLRSFGDICRMAAAGVGVGIVPETAARRAAETAGLAVLPLAEPWAVRRLSLCVQRGADLSPLARGLLRHLEKSGPDAPES